MIRAVIKMAIVIKLHVKIMRSMIVIMIELSVV